MPSALRRQDVGNKQPPTALLPRHMPTTAPTMAAARRRAMRLRTNDTHIMDTTGQGGAVDGKYIIVLLRHGLVRHIGAAAASAARS